MAPADYEHVPGQMTVEEVIERSCTHRRPYPDDVLEKVLRTPQR
jgi:hypothetical protein